MQSYKLAGQSLDDIAGPAGTNWTIPLEQVRQAFLATGRFWGVVAEATVWGHLAGLVEGEAGIEVEVEGPVGVDVAVDERVEASSVDVVENDGRVVVVEDLLDHEGVDVDETGLE